MIFSKDGTTTIITQERATIAELVRKIQETYSKVKYDNIIVNLSSLGKVSLEQIIEFLQVSNEHRGSKRSFVIVTNKISIDDIPDELVVVPTLQEAYDIIEMEEMERDLGL
ncbi:ribonuclease Z [Winogradskyella sp. 3972H.M.0a.05]|uniref:ribonuclease Z n=1 Tax=Winogradskyella sp. 3972H.M.0a.05 TaxID=2950277 RepID=UPI0033998390